MLSKYQARRLWLGERKATEKNNELRWFTEKGGEREEPEERRRGTMAAAATLVPTSPDKERDCLSRARAPRRARCPPQPRQEKRIIKSRRNKGRDVEATRRRGVADGNKRRSAQNKDAAEARGLSG